MVTYSQGLAEMFDHSVDLFAGYRRLAICLAGPRRWSEANPGSRAAFGPWRAKLVRMAKPAIAGPAV